MPSPSFGNTPSTLNSAIEVPREIRAAAFAKAIPVALLTNGTVLDARGLASKTYKIFSAIANWILIKPKTPTPRAIFSVASRIDLYCSLLIVIAGRTQALSPEWIPASSICSIIPPKNNSLPSKRASTSSSIALSRNLSTSTGWSGVISVARDINPDKVASS